MPALTRFAVLAAVWLCAAASAGAQATPQESSGAITGCVTLQGNPVPGVVVTARLLISSPQPITPLRAATDTEGRYRFAGLAAGQYTVTPLAPGFAAPTEGTIGLSGKSVTLREGETAEDVDFAIARGGVITGRVTDANGRPVIEESVRVTRLDERGHQLPFFFSNSILSLNQTDDRGIYRLFGLPPGRYLASAGSASPDGQVTYPGGRAPYLCTYHPNVTDPAKATILEVTAGSETGNADITLAPRPGLSEFYAVTGRILDAETGQPLPLIEFYVSPLRPGERSLESSLTARSDEQGGFRIERVAPGRYGIKVKENATDYFGNPSIFGNQVSTVFEVRDGDVSGVVTLEGIRDPALRAAAAQNASALLSRLRVSLVEHEGRSSTSGRH
jgi:hypothetical protein